MRTKYRVTVERLQELLRLDPETGLVYWRVNRGPSVAQSRNHSGGWYRKAALTHRDREPTPTGARAGERAGYPLHGIPYLKCEGVLMKLARVVFALHHGRWPDDEVRHANGDRRDCRPGNLIEFRSGERLIHRARESYYEVRATNENKRVVFVGGFGNLEEAIAARDAFLKKRSGKLRPQAVKPNRYRDEELWSTNWDGRPLSP